MSNDPSIRRMIAIGAAMTLILGAIGAGILVKQRQVRQARSADAVAAAASEQDARQQRAAYEARAAAESQAAQRPPVTAAFERLDAALARWLDAEKLAGASPRVSLGHHISTLQQIRRDTASIDGPECFLAARDKVTAGMGGYIDAMVDFMASRTSPATAGEQADAATKQLIEALGHVKSCRILLRA